MPKTSLLRGDIIFNSKPDAVPYNYRISYKVSQLCLIMRICGWGDSCSLIKLQMGGMKAKELIDALSALGEEKAVFIEDNQGNYYDIFPRKIRTTDNVIRILIDIDSVD